jgi:hypothetical protein
MAWTDGVDKSTGDVITAAIWTSYLGSGDGIDEMETAKVTTAGDIVYATGDNALARLGVGSARQVLQMNSGASAPEYAASAQSTMTAKGDILTATAANTIARLAVGADGTVLTAASGTSTGLSWGAAPGATAAANDQCIAMQPSGQKRAIAKRASVANRIYINMLASIRTTTAFTEFIAGEIDTGGNYILSVYSFDNTNLTRQATTGSTSVPSASGDLTKLALSFTPTVGTRYAMALSLSATPDHYAGTLDSSSTQLDGPFGYNDPGSFTHPSTIAWSAVTNEDTLQGPLGVWGNGNTIT